MSEAVVVEAGGGERERTRAVRLRIPAKPEYLSLARLALSGLAGLAGIEVGTLADLKLALTEAVTNSIRHGYRGQAGHVEILYELDADSLVLEVADDGDGFEAAHATGVGDDLAEGGLGIEIIRSLVDELEIESEPGAQGSRLRLVKHLRST